jgi:hypothetical protein
MDAANAAKRHSSGTSKVIEIHQSVSVLLLTAMSSKGSGKKKNQHVRKTAKPKSTQVDFIARSQESDGKAYPRPNATRKRKRMTT